MKIDENTIFTVLWEFLPDTPQWKINRYIEEMKKRTAEKEKIEGENI